MTDKNKRINELKSELDPIRPELKKYAGRSGYELDDQKLEALESRFFREREQRPGRKVFHLADHRIFRVAAAVALLVAVSFSAYFMLQNDHSALPQMSQAEDLDLYFYFLDEEAETLEDEWLIEAFGDLYLESLAGEEMNEELFEYYFYENSEFY